MVPKAVKKEMNVISEWMTVSVVSWCVRITTITMILAIPVATAAPNAIPLRK